MYIGITLLVFETDRNIPEEKDCLKRIVSWLDMSSFNSFRILTEILLGPSLLSYFKEEIILETSEPSVFLPNICCNGTNKQVSQQ